MEYTSYTSYTSFFCYTLLRMDLITTIIPSLTIYFINDLCLFSGKHTIDGMESRKSLIIRKYIWPILAVFMGFAWYFARRKAIHVQKRGQHFISVLSSIFCKHKHYILIDIGFIVLLGLLGRWLWLTNCVKGSKKTDSMDYEFESFIVLASLLTTLFMLLYVLALYASGSFVLLLPLLIWLLSIAIRRWGDLYTFSRFMDFKHFVAQLRY